MRSTTILVVLFLSACSLDFDALERGRGDVGAGIDASLRSDAGDAASIDGSTVDAHRAVDAGPLGDAAHADDVGTDASAAADAFTAPDAFTAADAGTDAYVPCAVLNCGDPSCLGRSCDDGLVCTSGDVCTAAGTCGGSPVTCPTNECAAVVCTEPAGCHVSTAVADGAVCTGGRCCFGRCSGLHDSGNCAGCGLGCDEESCSGDTPPTCVCVTNAGCPSGQTCSAGLCVCTNNGQCATGQRCVTGRCIY